MKINEIINESPWSDLKAGFKAGRGIGGKVAGAVAGFKQGQAAAPHIKAAEQNAASWAAKWAAIAKANPAVTADDLQRYAQKLNLGATIPAITGGDAALKDPVAVKNYFSQAFALGAVPKAPAAKQQVVTQPLQQPAGATTQPAPAQQLAVSVVNSSPVVLKYRNRDYALNSKDQWVFFGSSRAVSPEMSAFLFKQYELL